MSPGTLMIGVLGRLSVGKGQGQDGVPGVGREGTTVGVVEFDEVGGVLRLGGGVLDSCTIVVFGSWDGEVPGFVDAPGVGAVDGLTDGLPLAGSLGSVPTLGRFGWLPPPLPDLGASHFGQATVVCWANCSIVASASTPDFSDSGGSFGASSPRAWRAFVMKVVIAVIELSSPSCWYDATSRDTPLRACTEKSSSVLLIVPTAPPESASCWTSDNRVIACSRSRRPRESSPTLTLVETFSMLRFIPYKVSPGIAC